jgi:hypothetical protein
MSTRRQRRAARANGKKSKGPVTPEGKARSAANATRHGLAAGGSLTNSVCLTIENRDKFVELHEEFIAEHAPATHTERILVEEMAVTRWRQQRAWLLETYLLENQMDQQTGELDQQYESMSNPVRLALAFRGLAEDSPSLPLVQRYEARLSRQFERCLKRLEAMRGKPTLTSKETSELLNGPSEPNPISEHQPAPAEPVEAPPPPAASPAPAPDCERRPAVSPAAAPPEVAVFPRRTQRDDHEGGAEPAGLLPRAA